MGSTAPPLGKSVVVAENRLWSLRSGRGEPAVVFLPGAGALGLDYLLCHRQISGTTTSVIYDRGGTGWSGPLDLPRPAEVAAEEVRSLLTAHGVPSPYVLVGHSLGGAHARVLAHRYPDEVAGLVLLEPLHEDWDTYQPAELQLARLRRSRSEAPEPTSEMLAGVRHHVGQLLSGFPRDVRAALLERHADRDQIRSTMRDGINVLDVLADLSAGSDPDVPTIVVGATGLDPGQLQLVSAELLERQIAGQQELYEDYAAAAPNREYRALSDTSHSGIPFERPDAVTDAVRDVLDRAA